MKEAIKITLQEIEWHKANKSEAPTFAHAEAFIKGLEHLRDLFNQAENIQPKDSADYTACRGCGYAYPTNELESRYCRECQDG